MLALRLLSEGGEGPNTELLWVLWTLLAFFALAVIAGWLSSLRKSGQTTAEAEAVSSAQVDDLVILEGIGPKVAKILAQSGIRTFEDLASAKKAHVQKILDQAGFQMMDPTGWIDQSKLAAKGDWEALEKMKSSLKGGRKKK